MYIFFKQWMHYFGFAAFFSLFINSLQLVFPIYMLLIYDKVFASQSIPTLITVTTGALLALIVFGCLDFLRSRLLIRASIAIDQSLTKPVISEMLRDAIRVDNMSMQDGLADINLLRNYFSGNAAFSFFDLPWVPIYLFAVFSMNQLLGWLAICGAVIILLLGIAQELLTGQRFTLARNLERQGSDYFRSGFRNAESLISMNMLPGFISHWMHIHEHTLSLQTKAFRFGTLLTSISKTFRTFMQVAVYGVGAYLVLENEATAGVMIASSIITRQALGPIDSIMSTWKQSVDARSAYQRINALLSRTQPPEKMSLPDLKGSLSADSVNFTINGSPIVKNISFSIEPGESLGLIGPSGAGKSTLCRLLLGIWTASTGKIRLDGAEICTWNKDSLGKQIGYLPQDVELFDGTVSENIARMGAVDAEKVIQASTLAGVHEMILRLPQGYDTPLGEQGANLSGGQRQLIGLARVFYGLPKLVILDEPNSNLDDQGERFLQHALQEFKKLETTVIIVTHKPSLLSSVDKVLVLRDGTIAFFGPRDDVFRALSNPT